MWPHRKLAVNVHSWEALNLDCRGLGDPFLPEGLQNDLGQLHLSEGLDGRRDILPFREDVPLLAYPLIPALQGFPDVAGRSPAGSEGLSVGDPSCQLAHAHQGTGFLDVVENLLLLNTLLVQLRDLVGCSEGRKTLQSHSGGRRGSPYNY